MLKCAEPEGPSKEVMISIYKLIIEEEPQGYSSHPIKNPFPILVFQIPIIDFHETITK